MASLVELILAAESPAAARDMVRRSGVLAERVAADLRDHASAVADTLPAASAIAGFLAGVVETLDVPQPWPGDQDLSSEMNDVLLAASMQPDWPSAFALLRANRQVLDPRGATAVFGWHSSLAQAGFTRSGNGAVLAITLGTVLGGEAAGTARLLWARGWERESPARARHHFVRAITLLDRYGAGPAAPARAAFEAFLQRHPELVPTGGPPAQSDDLLREFGDGMTSIPLRENWAYSLRESGRLTEARTLLDETISLCRRYGVPTSEQRLCNLRGLVLDDLGEYDPAESDYRRAAELADELDDAPRAFEARNNAAAGYLKRGLPEMAAQEFRAILRRADSSGNTVVRAAARNNLAHACMQADRYEQARALYAEALALLGDGATQSHSIALKGLVGALHALGDEAAGKALEATILADAVAREDDGALMLYLTASYSDLSPEFEEIADGFRQHAVASGDLLWAASLSIRLAKHHEARGRQVEAVHVLDECLARFGDHRSRVPTLINVEVEAARLELSSDSTKAVGAARLRAVVDRVEARLAEVTQSTDADWLLDAARPAYLRLIEHLAVDGSPSAVAEAFWLHEAARPATLTTIRPVEGARNRTPGVSPVIAAMSVEVGPATAVVSFVATDLLIGCFVLVPGANQPTFLRFDLTPNDVRDAVAEFGVAVNGDPGAFPPRSPLDPARPFARALPKYVAVMTELGRLGPALGTAELACLVSAPLLEGLPVHAAVVGEGRYLVQDVGCIYQPSLTALIGSVARPPFDGSRARVFVAGVAADTDAHPEYFEADAQLFDGYGEVEVALGAAATPERVLNGLRSADIAHLTCHGFVDAHDPLGSGLLLSDGSQRPSRRRHAVPVLERGRFALTSRQLAERPFEVGLLTLRACSTARRSAAESKDERATLLRAFQLGGCRTVVSALWNVDQSSSLDLTRRLYARYLKGQPAWKALAEAQRDMIAGGGATSHVYHWGPFIAAGDWRQT